MEVFVSLGGKTLCSLLPISHFEVGGNCAKLLAGHVTPRGVSSFFNPTLH